MILAFVGSGGKTTLIKEIAQQFRHQGKSVFITTTTHMFMEPDALLTDDAATIIAALRKTGYAMSGIPSGEKITALSSETYKAVCEHADVVLVEADGSRQLPLKYPNAEEPVIPENADEIIVVCGLNAIGRQAQNVCHRLELVKSCLSIGEDTIITAAHIQKLVTDGYLNPLKARYPDVKVTLMPHHDGTLYQRALASLLRDEQPVDLIRKEWFSPQPSLFLCGGGHVAKEVAALAAHLDFSVTVLDDRSDLANRERFPTAEHVICDSYDHLSGYLEPNAYYVVVTPDHKADLQCVHTILPTAYRYLGMIGSKGKVAATFENLRKMGFTENQINTIFAPIGLSIGAVTPAEIAVSILSQIIQEKNRYHKASVDRKLLEVSEPGMLCIVVGKQGSAPRGIGSMMFVAENFVLGSIGGGEPEYMAIRHARENRCFSVKELILNNSASTGLDMICGGTISVAFIPV